MTWFFLFFSQDFHHDDHQCQNNSGGGAVPQWSSCALPPVLAVVPGRVNRHCGFAPAHTGHRHADTRDAFETSGGGAFQIGGSRRFCPVRLLPNKKGAHVFSTSAIICAFTCCDLAMLGACATLIQARRAVGVAAMAGAMPRR